MSLAVYLAVIVFAYFLGSIPFGYLTARVMGVDIRTLGSGNIGATNVFRVLGKPAGIIVLVCDGLKGWFAAAQVPAILLSLFHLTTVNEHQLELLTIIGGISAILGHNYTCWLRFKGGKGIATSAGAMAAMFPSAFLVAIAVFIVALLASRYVSLGSILAAASLPVAALLFHRSPLMIGVAFFIGALAIYKHKANIQRLINGTENRIGKKKENSQE
ncbi:MAG: acyl-phosphate glycerol-3-phosphate acyltransferase [Verrucomicrobiales bacterium]|nr:acyl-phosphate glycerol-3-phosphate acyltransferase [Verrucomicrobiales bacterium]